MGEKVKPNPKPDDPEQSKRFEEAARQLGTDESENAFEKALDVSLPIKTHQSPPEPPQ